MDYTPEDIEAAGEAASGSPYGDDAYTEDFIRDYLREQGGVDHTGDASVVEINGVLLYWDGDVNNWVPHIRERITRDDGIVVKLRRDAEGKVVVEDGKYMYDPTVTSLVAFHEAWLTDRGFKRTGGMGNEWYNPETGQYAEIDAEGNLVNSALNPSAEILLHVQGFRDAGGMGNEWYNPETGRYAEIDAEGNIVDSALNPSAEISLHVQGFESLNDAHTVVRSVEDPTVLFEKRGDDWVRVVVNPDDEAEDPFIEWVAPLTVTEQLAAQGFVWEDEDAGIVRHQESDKLWQRDGDAWRRVFVPEVIRESLGIHMSALESPGGIVGLSAAATVRERAVEVWARQPSERVVTDEAQAYLAGIPFG
ncbi:MAG: hypothetical protein OXE50_13820, partial [Chloroflexi bacterium]|nr:hypothetical protein [Chloroflexota bacterium]